MRSPAIVLLCIVSAVAYGVAHDQITARICLEYFTVGHPAILPPEVFDSPTWQGLAWGIIASWWVGLLLGVPLAIAARFGRRPRRGVRSLLRPIGTLLAAMAGVALVLGIVGFVLARLGAISLVDRIASRVPEPSHDAYLGVLWTHLGSYAAGLVGGVVVIVRVWRSRSAASALDGPPQGGPMGQAGPDGPIIAR